MQETLIRDDERVDDLQIKGYRIIQNPQKFCFGIDAVLLSDFANVKNGDKVIDLGTGTGIIPILLEAKTEGKSFVGLEIQKDSVEMAKRSVLLNNLTEKVEIIQGDIKEAGNIFKAASFDIVTTNPPYMINQHGLQNPEGPKAIARHEICCNLEDVITTAAKLLKPKGHFFMVHRPFRLVEILKLLSEKKIEPKRMRLVYPYIDSEPNMVLIEGVRGGNSRLSVEKPLIVYKAKNEYSDEIKEIYGYNQ